LILLQKSEKLRILVYTPTPEFTGGFYRCFFLSKYIATRHDVTLICSNPQPMWSVKEKIVDKVSFKLLPMQKKLTPFLLADFLRLIKNYKEILSDYDIVHMFVATVPSSGFAVFFAKMLETLHLKDSKLFVDWEDWWGRGGIWSDYPKLFDIMGTFLEEEPIKIANGITVVSDKLKDRAISLGVNLKRIFKIPNGANIEAIKLLSKDEARKQLMLADDADILCHIGFTHPIAFEKMIYAFDEVAKRQKNVLLILVGYLNEQQLSIVNKSENRKKIVYVGKQPYEKIPLFLAVADVLLLFMRDFVQEDARWPIRLGDYLAGGRPIVATAMAEVSNVINECKCGMLAKPDNAKDFADKINYLIENPTLCKILGRNARKGAEEKYAWGLVAKRLEKAYKNLQD